MLSQSMLVPAVPGVSWKASGLQHPRPVEEVGVTVTALRTWLSLHAGQRMTTSTLTQADATREVG